MKFPTSMFPEGSQAHSDTEPSVRVPRAELGQPGGVKRPMSKAGAKIDFGAPLQDDPCEAAQPPRVSASVGAAPGEAAQVRRKGGVNPWVVGAGACFALAVLAVAMSRQFTSMTEPVEAQAPQLLGQAEQTPQEAQLQTAPPAAGPTEPQAQAPVQAQEEAPPALPPATAQPKQEVATPPATPVAPKPAAQAKPEPLHGKVLALNSPQAQPRREPAPELAVTPAPAPAPQVVPAPPDDAGITAQVKGALAADALLAAATIDVSTNQGVVKLEGQVPDAQLLSRASVIAAGMTGVKSVDNRLTLPPPVSPQAQQTQQQPAPPDAGIAVVRAPGNNN